HISFMCSEYRKTLRVIKELDKLSLNTKSGLWLAGFLLSKLKNLFPSTPKSILLHLNHRVGGIYK
ncbi:MAG: hypothetical protein D4Q79_01675, partial [Spirochaetia bacterium]